jgi:predicted DNA-binding transcriptional regulator AlpA
MPGSKRRSTPVPSAVYTIREFCDAHQISRPMYYKLRKQGKGPREMRIGTKVLIAHESAQAWRRSREG